MELALGTVQFGLNYGIINKNGQVSIDEIKKILDFAIEKNINTLDTARGYGDSEKVLGKVINDKSKFQIITKIPKIDFQNKNFIQENVQESLKNLRIEQMYGLMLHNENDFNDFSYNALLKLKVQKIVTKIGVSVYSPDILLNIIDNYNIDIVQIPLNIFDQRFVCILSKLKEKNIEINIRSLFLQGVLLNPDIILGAKTFTDQMIKYKKFLLQNNITPIEACFGFIKNIKEIDKIVIGCTSLNELEINYKEYVKNIKTIDFKNLSTNIMDIINPSLWKK